MFRQLGGDFKKRTACGVRLLWNKGENPGFLQRWSSHSAAMPWWTFTYHPLGFTEEGAGNERYDVKNFSVAVVQAIKEAYSKHNPGKSC